MHWILTIILIFKHAISHIMAHIDAWLMAGMVVQGKTRFINFTHHSAKLEPSVNTKHYIRRCITIIIYMKTVKDVNSAAR